MQKKEIEERCTCGVFLNAKNKFKQDAHVESFFLYAKKKQVEDRCAWSLLCIKKSVEDRYARGVFLCIQNKLKKDTHVELFMNKKTSRRKIHTWSFYA